jgi:hypothetical protein
MGILNSSLSNLLGGVSQQAESLRGASNCEEQTNAYPSPVNGLVKRPPTQFMTDALGANFQDANALDTASHLINRDSSERYLLTISGKTIAEDDATSVISVWDLENNVAKTVYYDEDAVDYLNATDSTTAFSFATAGDVTYINNKEVTPKMLPELSTAAIDNAIVHVRQGASDTEYNIKLEGITVTHETPTSGDNSIKTSVIATGLYNGLISGKTATLHSDTAITLPADHPNDGTSMGYNGTTQYHAFKLNISTGTPLTNLPTVKVTGSVVRFVSEGTYPMYYKKVPHGVFYPIATGANYRIRKTDSETAPSWIELETMSGEPMLRGWNGNNPAPAGTASIVIEDTQGSTNFSAYTFTKHDSTILIHDTIGVEDFNIETSDSVGDTYLKAFKGSTQYFSDLPESCIDGMRMKVTGSVESAIDDYYVEFSTSGSNTYGKGSWIEKASTSTRHKIDTSTMPHILIRQSDGTFLFKPADGLTTPDDVTSGFALPVEETLSCSGVGAYDTNDTTYTVDGLVADTVIKAGSRLLVPAGGSDEVILGDATVALDGSVSLTTAATLGNFSDDEAMQVKLVGDYSSFEWEERKAGDDVTNPLPNFIGNPINDIFFYENRLGMLSGESVTLSESGQFFNFFRTTIIDLLDTAPIEVVGSSNSVNTLRHALPFNSNLLLFGDNTQFMLGSGQEGLSPKTVAMSQVSNYECDPNCAPAIGGTSVFFAYPRGSYGGLQDMVIRDPEARDLQAFDLTDSVPSYIENPFRAIATMPQENLVIGLPKAEGGDMQDLYLYKYLDRGNERIQSAWFKFTLSSFGAAADDTQQIIGIHTVENVLYVLSRFVDSVTPNSSHTSIHKIEFTTEGITDLFSQPPLLDNVLSRLGNNSGLIQDGGTLVDGDTVFTLPYGSEGKSASDFQIITKHKTGDDGGVVIPILSGTFLAESTTLTVDGDKRAEHVWIGSKYDMTYKYASPIFKGPSSGGGASLVTSGRYQIHSADIVYHDTNTFNVAVSVEGRSDYSYTFTADTTQVDVTSEGSVGLDSGDMRIPIHAKNDTYDMTITSDSAYPVKLLSTEFEAQYNARSRRMGI